MDNITESFPELAEALMQFSEPVILDGEILAWEILNEEKVANKELSSRAERGPGSPEREARWGGVSAESRDHALDFDSAPRCGATGRALPFTQIQQRLGRKSPSADLIRQYPVAYLAFDVLYANGDLVIDKPLRERREMLGSLFARLTKPMPDAGFSVIPQNARSRTRKPAAQQYLFGQSPEPDANHVPLPPLILAPTYHAATSEELDQLFDAAQSRGNEGLMLKDLDSLYTPGRRGKSWLKVKRELATLDVVVTSVEFGHGKRAGVLSDYTFAVRAPATDPDATKDRFQLLNVGKAYSGLTDREIADMTEWFKAHTREDHGHFRIVDPEIVLEVAFNNVMESDRHGSGYALRFPRIMRLRPDKPAAEIDTLERVREIFETQHKVTPPPQ